MNVINRTVLPGVVPLALELIPSSSAVLEKLIVPQLLKKILTLVGTGRFVMCTHELATFLYPESH